jgi:mRNA-degrading endonuclease RelE of RelBE toxin-antitoxin system
MNDIEYHSRVLAALDALDSKEREQIFAVVASLKNDEVTADLSRQFLSENQNGQVFVYRVGPSLRLVVRRTCDEPMRYEITDVMRREAIESYAAR